MSKSVKANLWITVWGGQRGIIVSVGSTDEVLALAKELASGSSDYLDTMSAKSRDLSMQLIDTRCVDIHGWFSSGAAGSGEHWICTVGARNFYLLVDIAMPTSHMSKSDQVLMTVAEARAYYKSVDNEQLVSLGPGLFRLTEQRQLAVMSLWERAQHNMAQVPAGPAADKVLLWISRTFCDQDLLIECVDHEEAWELNLKLYVHHQILNGDYTRWSVKPLSKHEAVLYPLRVQHLAVTQMIQLTMLTGFAEPPVLSNWSATKRQCLLLTREEAKHHLFKDRGSLLAQKGAPKLELQPLSSAVAILSAREKELISAAAIKQKEKAVIDAPEEELTIFSDSSGCNIDFEALD
jgi:hypothetical protein